MTAEVPTFSTAVGQLVASGGLEPGFDATVLGMSNAMGIRPGAGVCAIIITDEDADSGTHSKADALAALNSQNAVFLGIVTSSGNSENDYGPNAGSLSAETGGQTFDLLAFRADPQPVLDAIIATCVGFITDFTLSPGTDENPVLTSHTVTATLTRNQQPVSGELIDFEVISRAERRTGQQPRYRRMCRKQRLHDRRKRPGFMDLHGRTKHRFRRH